MTLNEKSKNPKRFFSRVSDVRREITKFTSRQNDKPTKTPVVTEVAQENPTITATHGETVEETNINDVSIGGMSTNSSQNSSPGKNTPSFSRSKLPKLILPKFKGDITNYRTFWETFESAVHNNGELTTIDKFNYLFSLLEGQALRAIKGLAITEDNYNAAVDILQERFGKTQQIIAAHMDELLKISACDGDKSKQLRFVYDKVSVNVRALEALGIQSDQYGSLLIPVIMSKLPSDVRLQIARKTEKDVWVIKDLLEIIRKEVEARELSEQVKANNDSKKPPPPKFPTISSLTAQEAAGVHIKCAYCGKQHYSASCETVVQLSERKDILRRAGRCFVCLRIGHRSNQCFPTRKCRRCEGAHHQSICTQSPTKFSEHKKPGTEVKPTDENASKPAGSNSNAVTANQISTTATRSKCKVFLQTATTYACSPNTTSVVPVRVLMDSGSQRSYVTESLKQKLGLVPDKTEVLNLNTFGDDKFRKQRCDQVRLLLQGQTKDIEISALCFPKICSPLSMTLDIERYPHLDGLVPADQSLLDNSAPNIDILIGSDYYFEVIMGEIRRGDKGPVAVQSEFGWLISGNGQALSTGKNETLTNLTLERPEHPYPADLVMKEDEDELTNAVRKFWNTESVGIIEPDQSTEREFLRGLQFNEASQRYQVSLPWKEECQPIASGYLACVSRVRQTHSRLKKDPELLKEYANVIKQQQDLGIIERIAEKPGHDESAHYLPHHAVVRREKSTTKVRVVFDGSAKHGKSTFSINECLEKGPNLVPHLFDVLVTFRGYPIGIAADVEKAFHQIEIHPDDRKMLRFLWFDDTFKEHPEIVQFQFCRLVFGLTPSPAILSSLIQHHLEKYEQKEPMVTALLQDSFYVDDFVGGSTHDDQAIEIYEKSNEIMKEGGFGLRKWTSNSKIFRERVAAEEQRIKPCQEAIVKPLGSERSVEIIETSVDSGNRGLMPSSSKYYQDITEPVTLEDQSVSDPSTEDEHSSVKILGIPWNTESDEFEYDLRKLIDFVKTLPSTKRAVLRLSAKIFDPLGLLAPFTIVMKMLFQDLCIDGTNWDDPLVGNLLHSWNQIINDLYAMKTIRVSRCYFSYANHGSLSYELHGFCDASSKAYAAVVYLRTVHRNRKIEVSLVASKTRVAPTKRQSIPRLELLGATILARLVSSVQVAITSLPIVPKVFLWTDSRTVLCWIRNHKAWKPYVQHRVSEIRKLTTTDSWNFCPGEKNPADLPSRGIRGPDLAENEIWWNGAEFLQFPKEMWPSEPGTTEIDENEANAEIMKSKTPPSITRSLNSVSETVSPPNVGAVIDCKRYSSQTRLLRVTAWVKRFIDNARRRRSTSDVLTADELKAAEKLWIKSIQASSYKDEEQYLSQVNKKEPLLVKQLGLFRDQENIIRCHGRIDESSLSLSEKQPILLPPKHHFTDLVILGHHETVHHNGIKETLNSIREKYWIVRGREAVKRIVRRCVVCKKLEGMSFNTPRTAPLPPSRVCDAPPFTNTGVDFAGPLFVTNRAPPETEKTSKAYVCLWTCASTRAIHLELVPNLSVPTFLQAFRRFSARRGLPTRLLSDNAKTFKGAAQEVKKIVRSKEIQQHLVNKGVTWDFIIEKAPWQGGFWERMVGSMKRCLKKAVGRASLSFEEMRTVLTEIEATLNNRPLTYLYDDEQGISYPLTPSSLIYGRTIATTPNDRQFEINSTHQSLTRRQKYHKRLLNEFTNQWRKEYLQSLRESSRASKGSVDNMIDVGDVVVLKDDKSTRVLWKLAKVEELIRSRDNVIRAAKVRVVNSDEGRSIVLRRPIQHLIPLELPSTSEEEDHVSEVRETPLVEQPHLVVPTARNDGRSRRNAAIIGEMLRKANKH